MEQGSTHAKIMIEILLNVHALTNMYRSSKDEEYRKSAAQWIPALESQFGSLKYELTKLMNEETGS
jgi:hypothetical protein